MSDDDAAHEYAVAHVHSWRMEEYDGLVAAYARGYAAGAAAENAACAAVMCGYCGQPGYHPARLGHVPHSANAQDWYHEANDEHYHPRIVYCEAAAIRARTPVPGAAPASVKAAG